MARGLGGHQGSWGWRGRQRWKGLPDAQLRSLLHPPESQSPVIAGPGRDCAELVGRQGRVGVGMGPLQ